MPDREWAYCYLKRHEQQISERMCQNIKRARAKVLHEVLEHYFENVARELKGWSTLKHHQKNLHDDSGKKKLIT